jgi:hypothetical protein
LRRTSGVPEIVSRPHFAGINTFLKVPSSEDVRRIGDDDVPVVPKGPSLDTLPHARDTPRTRRSDRQKSPAIDPDDPRCRDNLLQRGERSSIA